MCHLLKEEREELADEEDYNENEETRKRGSGRVSKEDIIYKTKGKIKRDKRNEEISIRAEVRDKMKEGLAQT